ncbi:hypothetical protein ABIC83_002469 [Roseateles asaccharophilus]|uniref:hypothetical protein n=1 Tax=Roseateles asaccharophilus TaxID=582607 RepID=UPI003834ACB6
MPRELKVWNGGGLSCRNADDPRWDAVKHNGMPHAFVCAYSQADARRVIEAYCGRSPTASEMTKFWSAQWGRWMEGVARERGLWLQFDVTEAPVRVDGPAWQPPSLLRCRCGAQPKNIASLKGVHLIKCSNDGCHAVAQAGSAVGAAELWNSTATRIR